jgi:hypothetical protein
MNPATHGTEGNAAAPVLYMALELSNKSWRLAFSDGAKRRQVSIAAGDLAKLACAVAKAKERFGLRPRPECSVATKRAATGSGCTGTW